MRRWGWVGIGLAALALGAVAAGLYWRFAPEVRRYYADGDTIRAPRETTTPRDILWQPPVKLSDLINTGEQDYEPRLSWDGLTLFFVRGKPGENADIFVSSRAPSGWTEPAPLTDINSSYDDLGPAPTADGKALYFYSDRPGGSGGYDIWVTRRGEERWQPPTNLGPAVNSEFNDYGAAVTPDGATLYFASNRPRPEEAPQDAHPNAWPATIREDLRHRTYDIYLTTFSDAGAAPATPIASLNTPFNEGAPCISPAGDFLYFASDRPGGAGGFDIYRTRRLNGVLQPPTPLAEGVNTPANELDPGLTSLGFALFFSSDRPMERVQPDQPNDYNVYYTSAREVFADEDRVAATPIDWAGLLRAIGPSLLWLLLALLLTLLLLALLRDMRDKRLSLLARCLLMSLLAHALLLLALSFWRVGNALLGVIRESGRTQIVLNSPARGDELMMQIRGDLTQVESPAAEAIETAAIDMPAPVQVETRAATLDVPPTEQPLDDTPQQQISTKDARVATAAVPTPKPAAEPLDAQSADVATPTEQAEPVRVAEADAAKPAAEHGAARRAVDDGIPVPDAIALRQVDVVARRDPNDTLGESSLVNATPTREAQPSATPPSTPAIKVALADEAQRAPDVALPAETKKMELQEAKPARADVVAAEPVRAQPQTDAAAPKPEKNIADTTGLMATNGHNASDTTLVSDTQIADARATPTNATLPLPTIKVALADDGMRSPDVALPAETQKLEQAEAPPTRADVVAAEPVRAQPKPDATAPTTERRIADTTGLMATNGHNPSDTTLVSDTQIVDARSAPQTLGLRTAKAQPIPVDTLPAINLPKLEDAPRSASATKTENVSTPSVAPAASFSGMSRPEPTVAANTPKVMFKTSIDSSAKRAASTPTDSLVSIDSVRSDASNGGAAALLPSPNATKVGALDAPSLELRLPTETETTPAAPFAQRAPEAREKSLRQMGGNDRTEHAVGAALAWLARHQSADGRWDAGAFDENCGKCGGASDALVTRATTGLSLLAFLGAGHTHLLDGPYRDVVRRGLTWLIDHQDDNGDLRGDETMYSHGIAAIALAEALGMTGDSALRAPAQAAIRFIVEARDPRGGGWRYVPGQAGDTSVTGWQVMALNSAKTAGLDTPKEAWDAARQWMERVEAEEAPGLYGYRPSERPTPSMTAEGMFARMLLGESPESERSSNGAQLLMRNKPDWDEALNTYYWYYATQALFHRGGADWQRWNSGLTRELLAHQRTKGAATGSWDPGGEWAPIGGRVYQTAICALMLEVYYRYLPMHSGAPAVAQRSAAPEDAIGSIHGRVRNALTGEPLAGVRLRVDLPDALPLIALTDADGAYELAIPQMPDFFAMTASTVGYSPGSLNISSADLRGRSIVRNYDLKPMNEDIVALEEQPEVRHLGNDAWEGAINSQFQRRSEGRRYRATFMLNARQAASRSPRVWVLVKGVQCPMNILINGTTLEHDYVESPADGSFGVFEIPFNPRLLVEGENVFEIRGVSCRGDLDDFEFVNAQIRLTPNAEVHEEESPAH